MLVSLDDFKKLGRLASHEEVRTTCLKIRQAGRRRAGIRVLHLPCTAGAPPLLMRQVRSEKLADLVIADNAHDIVRHLKRNKIVFYSHQ